MDTPRQHYRSTDLLISSSGFPSRTSLQIDFGIGKRQSDFLAITFPIIFSRLNPGTFQFEFSDLGGVSTGVEYPLMSFGRYGFLPPSPDFFAFAPDMAAAGWSGTFITTTTGVSVRFTSVPVPEPRTTALLMLQGALLVLGARRFQRKRRKLNTAHGPRKRV